MKTALLAAGLTALAALPLAAQDLPRISKESRPLQANSDGLPSACRGKPVPVEIEGLAYAGDGDTISIAGVPTRIRIWGIQASELRDRDKAETVPGMRARAGLEDLLDQAGHRVVCRPAKWDRYCRYVAHCEAAGSDRTDLGIRLIEAGLAYGFYLEDTFPGWPELSNSYASAEATARRDRQGLWPLWLGHAQPSRRVE